MNPHKSVWQAFKDDEIEKTGAQSKKIRYCNKCGALIQPDGKFCEKCGNRILRQK